MWIVIFLVYFFVFFDNFVNFSLIKSCCFFVWGVCCFFIIIIVGEVFGGGMFGKFFGVFIFGNNICYFGSN